MVVMIVVMIKILLMLIVVKQGSDDIVEIFMTSQGAGRGDDKYYLDMFQVIVCLTSHVSDKLAWIKQQQSYDFQKQCGRLLQKKLNDGAMWICHSIDIFFFYHSVLFFFLFISFLHYFAY